MARDSATRASDADRDRIAAALSEHLVAGRPGITVGSFRDSTRLAEHANREPAAG